MADDKKNIPEAAPPAEAPAPTVENAALPEQPAPEPELTDAEKVMLEHEGYEVTTYRIDGEYEDARHPKEVTFTSNLKLDLERRDFTINAMAYLSLIHISEPTRH